MAIPPTQLTEAFIRNLTYEDKPYVMRDTIIKGLMIVVNKHSESYKVQRDLWIGQRSQRRKAKRYDIQSGQRLNSHWMMLGPAQWR